MGYDRPRERTTASVERRPAASAVINRGAATALQSPIQRLQQKLGNQGTQALIHRLSAKPMVAANIHSLQSGGSPLPAATRAFFEPRFGADFSQVRVHTDTRSAEDAERTIQESSPNEAVSKALQSQGQPFPSELGQKIGTGLGADLHDVSVHTGSLSSVAAKAIGARAFTVGKDIHFDEGQYAPHTPEGQRLLAHEAVHTVQQTKAARSSSTLEISDPSDPAELEAESISAALQEDLSAQEPVSAKQSPVAQTYGTVLRQVAAPAQTAAPGTTPATASAGPTQTTAPPQIGLPEQKRVFLDKCGLVNTEIDAAKVKTEIYLDSLSLAYRDAWKNHTDALNEQKESERLVGDLILGAALAFIPGGIGGVIGKSMVNATKRDAFIVDGIKDLEKWGVRSTGQAGFKGGIGLPRGLTTFPDDPASWRDCVDMRVNGELLVAINKLKEWQARAIADDINFDTSFDPVVAMTQSLTIDEHPVSELKPVKLDDQSIVYEKGFWSEWLKKYGYKLVGQASRVGVFYGAEYNVGKKVRKRCEVVGLPIDPYIAEARKKVEDEARRRNDAARIW